MTFFNITNKNKAFSFIEIIVSLLVLGILIVPVYTIFSEGTTVTIRSRNEILALQQASNILSYAYSMPYDFLYPQPETQFISQDIDIDGQMVSLGVNENIFGTYVTIQESEIDEWGVNYKVVTVRVEWQEANTMQMQLSLSGLVAK